MGLDTKEPNAMPEELPIDFQFPPEYIRPEEPLPFAQECAESAGKAIYYDVEGIPVVEIFNDDGTISSRYGFQNGKFILEYPDEDSFRSEASIIRREKFLEILDSKRDAA